MVNVAILNINKGVPNIVAILVVVIMMAKAPILIVIVADLFDVVLFVASVAVLVLDRRNALLVIDNIFRASPVNLTCV